MLIAVRVIHGGGQGMLLALVPLYLSEVAPPHIRGFLTGLTTLSFGMGYVMFVSRVTNLVNEKANPDCYRVGWIAIACYHASNLTLSWRLPLALATVPPMALLAGLSFVSGRCCSSDGDTHSYHIQKHLATSYGVVSVRRPGRLSRSSTMILRTLRKGVLVPSLPRSSDR